MRDVSRSPSPPHTSESVLVYYMTPHLASPRSSTQNMRGPAHSHRELGIDHFTDALITRSGLAAPVPPPDMSSDLSASVGILGVQ